jgi:hypothetical protein
MRHLYAATSFILSAACPNLVLCFVAHSLERDQEVRISRSEQAGTAANKA